MPNKREDEINSWRRRPERTSVTETNQYPNPEIGFVFETHPRPLGVSGFPVGAEVCGNCNVVAGEAEDAGVVFAAQGDEDLDGFAAAPALRDQVGPIAGGVEG